MHPWVGSSTHRIDWLETPSITPILQNNPDPFLPLQALSLVQGPESSISVQLMVIDGRSHEKESRVGSIHTLGHLLVQVSNNSIPAVEKSTRDIVKDKKA